MKLNIKLLIAAAFAGAMLSGCGGGGDKVTNCSMTGLGGASSFSASGTVGTFFSRQFVNFGSVPSGCSLNWTTDGMPPGLTIDSGDGTVSGTPSRAGAYNSTIEARVSSRDGGSGDSRRYAVSFTIR